MSVTEVAPEAEVEVVKVPKRGVGTVAIEAIKAGADNLAALAAVRAEFPDAKTTLASVNWYRNKLRTDGDKSVPTARDLKAAAKAAAAETETETEADPLA